MPRKWEERESPWNQVTPGAVGPFHLPYLSEVSLFQWPPRGGGGDLPGYVTEIVTWRC